MRSTFSVLFYANKGKEKNGMVPVMGRITVNGTQSQFSCKHNIPLEKWDVKGNCAKGRSKETMQLNHDLDNIKTQIIKYYQYLSDRVAFVTAEMVRNAYQGMGELANGTIWQRCMWLKGVVMRAHDNGKIPHNPFSQFHISPNCKEREYLTEDELKQVMTHDFENADLAFVRDTFIFVCFTTLSFIDVKELITDNIVEVNGDKWIIGRRHKTNIPFQVKLMDVPLQIIDRYKHLQEEKLVFGKMRSTFCRLACPRTTGQCVRN